MTYRCGATFLLLLVAAALFLRHSAHAQVTFSRDWTAGKRSAGGGILSSDCSNSGRSVAALCHMLVGELRQLASCELRSQMNIAREDESMDTSASSAAAYPAVRSGR